MRSLGPQSQGSRHGSHLIVHRAHRAQVAAPGVAGPAGHRGAGHGHGRACRQARQGAQDGARHGSGRQLADAAQRALGAQQGWPALRRRHHRQRRQRPRHERPAGPCGAPGRLGQCQLLQRAGPVGDGAHAGAGRAGRARRRGLHLAQPHHPQQLQHAGDDHWRHRGGSAALQQRHQLHRPGRQGHRHRRARLGRDGRPPAPGERNTGQPGGAPGQHGGPGCQPGLGQFARPGQRGPQPLRDLGQQPSVRRARRLRPRHPCGRHRRRQGRLPRVGHHRHCAGRVDHRCQGAGRRRQRQHGRRDRRPGLGALQRQGVQHPHRQPEPVGRVHQLLGA